MGLGVLGVLSLAVAANLPDDEACAEAADIRLVACAQVVEYDARQYTTFLLERPVPTSLARAAEDAVEPGCADVGMIDARGCLHTNEGPDHPTEVRRVKGFGGAALLWPASPDPRPTVLLPANEEGPEVVMSRRLQRFLAEYHGAPIPDELVVRPRS